MMKRVLCYILCDLYLGSIMYFHVNASPPKQLDVLHLHRLHHVEGSKLHFMNVKVKGQIMYVLNR